MHAVSASFCGLAGREEATVEGTDDEVATGRDERPHVEHGAGARPPHTTRLPRSVPLSRASGATPTRAAICLRLRRPSSGTSATSVRLTTGPTPHTAHEI